MGRRVCGLAYTALLRLTDYMARAGIGAERRPSVALEGVLAYRAGLDLRVIVWGEYPTMNDQEEHCIIIRVGKVQPETEVGRPRPPKRDRRG